MNLDVHFFSTHNSTNYESFCVFQIQLVVVLKRYQQKVTVRKMASTLIMILKLFKCPQHILLAYLHMSRLLLPLRFDKFTKLSFACYCLILCAIISFK